MEEKIDEYFGRNKININEGMGKDRERGGRINEKVPGGNTRIDSREVGSDRDSGGFANQFAVREVQASEFYKALKKVRPNLKFGGLTVTLHDESEYKNTKNFLSDDGKSGFKPNI